MIKNPFEEVEEKWRRYWQEGKLDLVDLSDAANKLYVLVMFIYPSGDKLHIGHWYNYGPTDTWARYKKMQGFKVLEPIGYDAFGLPAENYAIKQGIHPAKSTAENVKNIREQLKAIGAMYDWSKEIDTSSPEYYKWTQWLFLQLYNNGLAYRKNAPVNWCPGCNTVLANEQVIDGRCERCESTVTRRDLEQWFFKITSYADRLLEGLDRIDWPEKTVTMQRNWIGRSEGAVITFRIPSISESFDVFTTRPDTLFGVTYMVLAPEHPLVEKVTEESRRGEVEEYVDYARRKTEIERTSLEKEKTGVFTGSYAVNPVNDEKIPIWISDYVLLSYGTGAVMAVPAHDQRDFEFAKKFDLPIRQVISVGNDDEFDEELFEAEIRPGIMINSGRFNGLDSQQGGVEVAQFLKKKNLGSQHVTYKLRDWLISRQRYWGAPIPIIYCSKCGELAVEESDLPVLLPEKVDFRGVGKSPLTTAAKFLNTTCHKCGSPATREVDTMDTFVCSSWYFLRYISPKASDVPWDRKLVDKWLPVDQYVGGAEHAVLHLLYARFITKVFYDLDLVGFDEPFTRLRHQGTITNKGAKMSKSRRNVVNPDHFIAQYGSDTFRMFMMFMGNYEDGGDWNDEGISGVFRFLNRIDRFIEENYPNKTDVVTAARNAVKADILSESEISPSDINALDRLCHYTIKSVGEDIERFHFNTAISRLMEYFSGITQLASELDGISKDDRWSALKPYLETFVLLLAPFAPHLGEEFWEKLGKSPSVFDQDWPGYDDEKLVQDQVKVVIQINGRLRGEMVVDAEMPKEELLKNARAVENVTKYLSDREIVREIIVPKKLVNFVVK